MKADDKGLGREEEGFARDELVFGLSIPNIGLG